MADKSKIEWCEATWNPTVGCSIVSPGCTNCYAMKVAHGGLTKVVNGNAVWTGEVRLDNRALLQPFKWKRGRRIFVNSMSDLFHENLSDADIDRVFAVMALCPSHTFQVLTKRAERMRDYLTKLPSRSLAVAQAAVWLGIWDDADGITITVNDLIDRGPLPNVWLGVSCERQDEADERIPHLLHTPAAVKFVSAEPLLGPIDFHNLKTDLTELGWIDSFKCIVPRHIDWIIVGGESGPKARPMHPQWARDIRDQCEAAGVKFFFKQWGEHRWHESRTLDDAKTYVVERVGKRAAGRLLVAA